MTGLDFPRPYIIGYSSSTRAASLIG